jgi:hypothetical protein
MSFFYRSVRTNIANMNFVGFVLVHGNHMEALGITATDMMKMKLALHVMHKRNCDLL